MNCILINHECICMLRVCVHLSLRYGKEQYFLGPLCRPPATYLGTPTRSARKRNQTLGSQRGAEKSNKITMKLEEYDVI